MKPLAWARLGLGWGTVVAFLAFGSTLFAAFAGPWGLGLLFLWLFATILWSAFGVVEEADHLAEMLGEPFGTLVLTLSVVVIEVALISAVMMGSAEPTLGRDTMFAVLMIVLNGMVGLCLLIGGLRYGEQSYNLQGASAYLAVIIPLTVIALVLPNFTRSSPLGTLTSGQAIAFSIFTLVFYGLFLAIQTGRHRHFFVMPDMVAAVPAHGPAGAGAILGHVLRLLVALLPIVLLAKQLAKILEQGLTALDAPPALGGVMIALIVFTPEGLASLRAVSLNQLQRTINLSLGAAASTIGLTVPAVLCIGVITGQTVVLGIDPTEMVILALTLMLGILTFSGPRTTLLEGAMHLLVFFVYLTLIFVP
jgi:Ca2+:H+ antiporter